jgi:hypothetical protein
MRDIANLRIEQLAKDGRNVGFAMIKYPLSPMSHKVAMAFY